ncbi:MAG: flagellar motor protein [Flavobacteriales bacterium]|jgi:chemotaxis protein MotA|nr:flagellar motor protein [Flavobacteriales bacterium]
MDILTLVGLIFGVGALLLGQYMEGGQASALLNGPAAVIVMGGSMGAIMLQAPMPIFMRSLHVLGWIFRPPTLAADEAIEKLIAWSNIARKEGLLGLEAISESEPDAFARKGLQLLVDGSEPEVMRGILEVEVDAKEHHDMQAANIYASMGGYTPTIGIIGAVMGLIQVMNNLADPSQLGHGIAVAFVATIYGVGAANLLLIPIANKLKSIIHGQTQFRLMIIEGIVSIAEGENPRNIQTKLQGYLH